MDSYSELTKALIQKAWEEERIPEAAILIAVLGKRRVQTNANGSFKIDDFGCPEEFIELVYIDSMVEAAKKELEEKKHLTFITLEGYPMIRIGNNNRISICEKNHNEDGLIPVLKRLFEHHKFCEFNNDFEVNIRRDYPKLFKEFEKLCNRIPKM